jgi:hypothetical protein
MPYRVGAACRPACLASRRAPRARSRASESESRRARAGLGPTTPGERAAWKRTGERAPQRGNSPRPRAGNAPRRAERPPRWDSHPPQGGRGERFSRREAKPFGTVGRLTEAEWVECLEWWTGQELNLGAPCCGRSLLRVSEAARAVGAADLRGLEGPTFPAYAPHAARMGSAGPQVLASGPSRAGRWRSTWCPSSGAVRLPAVPRGRVIAGWPWSGIRTHVSAREVSLPREERGEEPFSTTCQGSTRRDSTWSS